MRIQIKAHPRSRKEAVVKKGDHFYEVWVREVAEDGKANAAIVTALAEYLGVARSRVALVGGAGSKSKWVEVR